MKNFSYTKSQTLNDQIIKIEEFRTKIVLRPISPRNELQLQWDSVLEHVHYYFGLKDSPLPKDQIQLLFTPQGKKLLTEREKQAVRYKEALDYLYHEWLVNKNLVTADTIVTLYKIAFDGNLKISATDLNNALQYAQINPEYPLIQAALAQYFIIDLDPFSSHNEDLSYLVFLLFIYKTGYDFRRLLVMEKFFFNDLTHYKNLLAKLGRGTNLTSWLEYITDGVIQELQGVLKKIEEQEEVVDDQNLFELNDRQKSILTSFSEPGMKISNKMLQKTYRISQITASRDLAKLTSIGLLFAIGKGRSTYYTRV